MIVEYLIIFPTFRENYVIISLWIMLGLSLKHIESLWKMSGYHGINYF